MYTTPLKFRRDDFVEIMIWKSISGDRFPEKRLCNAVI